MQQTMKQGPGAAGNTECSLRLLGERRQTKALENRRKPASGLIFPHMSIFPIIPPLVKMPPAL